MSRSGWNATTPDSIVEGQVPPDLNGSLYRVGPNPQVAPRGRYNPLLGDGMVHAFHLHNGRVSHRNRWVRTIQWKREREAARALFGAPGFPAESDPSVAGVATDGVANTNLVWHANRLLVLEEGHAPIAASIHCRSIRSDPGASTINCQAT